ncbi:GNAT family N-acetyltransferase [Pseudomonas sp. efr-133-TYG-103a]|uniref:GNAT family N-acetyltransferase n=1 Tax=Pseudomonas sp. efr-133-TYG-103a TaxID=3040308 RepID=UPI002554E2E6|nr:GNAT family N-acetyltransferase [Pseudomonas sp. efr-133-TYG-103a]
MILTPMTESDFEAFLSHSIAGYAQDVQRTYHVPASYALDSATQAFNALLPDGLLTEDHHLFRLETLTGQHVGTAWFGVQIDAPLPAKLFIYDLEIHQAFQRQGFASLALQAIERWAEQRDIRRLELNVFAHNEAAQGLYRRAGMQVSEMTMGKDLRGVASAE